MGMLLPGGIEVERACLSFLAAGRRGWDSAVSGIGSGRMGENDWFRPYRYDEGNVKHDGG